MRTTPMISGALALAVMLTPAAVLAQSTETDRLPTPAHWTGIGPETDTGGFGVPVGIEFYPWGYRQTVGLSYAAEADDPRAAGDIHIVYTVDWSEKHKLGRGIGLARLANEGGSFEGPINVVYYPDGSEFRVALMEGQGGYEGLIYSMSNFLEPGGRGQPQGLIWEGEMPAVPSAELLPD